MRTISHEELQLGADQIGKPLRDMVKSNVDKAIAARDKEWVKNLGKKRKEKKKNRLFFMSS